MRRPGSSRPSTRAGHPPPPCFVSTVDLSLAVERVKAPVGPRRDPAVRFDPIRRVWQPSAGQRCSWLRPGPRIARTGRSNDNRLTGLPRRFEVVAGAGSGRLGRGRRPLTQVGIAAVYSFHMTLWSLTSRSWITVPFSSRSVRSQARSAPRTDQSTGAAIRPAAAGSAVPTASSAKILTNRPPVTAALAADLDQRGACSIQSAETANVHPGLRFKEHETGHLRVVCLTADEPKGDLYSGRRELNAPRPTSTHRIVRRTTAR